MAIDKLLNNLSQIEKHIDEFPSPATFRSNNEFMEHSVKLMNYCLYLLKTGAAIIPEKVHKRRGYTKRQAIIVGHIVRIAKLYEGLLIHTSQGHLDLAVIFTRLIFETSIKTQYLMNAKASSFHSFVRTSYKPEKNILEDLAQKAKRRPLINIEKRMRRKIKSRLKRDKISIKSLSATRNWNLDGKDFRRLLKDVGAEEAYFYSFGNGSHFVHGDWSDIYLNHLEKDGNYYSPKLEFNTPDPRIACPITLVCLMTLHNFIKWNKSDPDKYVLPIIKKLGKLVRLIDNAHEATMSD